MTAVEILSELPQTGWYGECIQLLPPGITNGTDNNVKLGIVDKNGNPIPKLDRDAWGITYQSCQKYCSKEVLPPKIEYGMFAASITNYMLPWLALTAQLPFEAGNLRSNFMSWCLAVGSPTLVTFSLAMTFANKCHARRVFKDLSNQVQDANHQVRMKAAEFLVSECQQVPLHIPDPEWFLALVHLEENGEWWRRLHTRLQQTRRGVTTSLIAQISMAVLAWIFTMSAGFLDALQEHWSATQIAASNVWTWLLPIVTGWIIVGTQHSHITIDAALRADEATLRRKQSLVTPHTTDLSNLSRVDLTRLDQENTQLTDTESPPSTKSQSEPLSPQPRPASPSSIRAPVHHSEYHSPYEEAKGLQMGIAGSQHCEAACEEDGRGSARTWKLPIWESPTFLGAAYHGDERQQGPVYNYARMFTHGTFANILEREISITVHSQGLHRLPPIAETMARGQKCHLDVNKFLVYSTFESIAPRVWKSILRATLVSTVVQWGTTGASIVIAYRTPAIGLGCVSLSFLVYACTSTIACGILIVSVFLSHASMLAHQTWRLKNHSTTGGTTTNDSPVQIASPRHIRILGSAAVLARITGKALAAINAIGLVLTSSMLLSSAIQTCWCQAAVLSRGDKAYVPLFKPPNAFKEEALPAWAGGWALSAVVAILGPSGFWIWLQLVHQW